MWKATLLFLQLVLKHWKQERHIFGLACKGKQCTGGCFTVKTKSNINKHYQTLFVLVWSTDLFVWVRAATGKVMFTETLFLHFDWNHFWLKILGQQFAVNGIYSVWCLQQASCPDDGYLPSFQPPSLVSRETHIPMYYFTSRWWACRHRKHP